MRKTSLLFLSTLLIATTAYAGGSIFGGHKHKTSNPNGVYSIGLHICSSLECPPVRIIQGKCTGDHMSKHWGVCICDEGYEARNNVCVLEGKCPDGSDRQIKTYQDGECCSVWHTVEFCPGDDPLPTCTREASCDYDEGTCSENSGSYAKAHSSEGHICCLNSEAKCADEAYVDNNGCTCVPKGADDDQWSCGIDYHVCRTCETGWIAKCGGYECVCVPKGAPEQGECSLYECKLCATDEIAKCSTNMECICVSKDTAEQTDCAFDKCQTCNTGEVAKCSPMGYVYDGACICMLDKTPDDQWKCNDMHCIYCPDGTGIATCDGEYGECSCVKEPACSSTIGDPCVDNSTVCPGYYCSIAPGTSSKDSKTGKERCGDAVYTPGAGTIQALGTPRTPKDGYLSSPEYVASWDAAVNYCDALKSTIAAGVTVNDVDYSAYNALSTGLAQKPDGCAMYDTCSALPYNGYYWLNGLIQWDCKWENYSTTYGSNSCLAFLVSHGYVNSNARGNFDYFYGSALCE